MTKRYRVLRANRASMAGLAVGAEIYGPFYANGVDRDDSRFYGEPCIAVSLNEQGIPWFTIPVADVHELNRVPLMLYLIKRADRVIYPPAHLSPGKPWTQVQAGQVAAEYCDELGRQLSAVGAWTAGVRCIALISLVDAMPFVIPCDDCQDLPTHLDSLKAITSKLFD